MNLWRSWSNYNEKNELSKYVSVHWTLQKITYKLFNCHQMTQIQGGHHFWTKICSQSHFQNVGLGRWPKASNINVHNPFTQIYNFYPEYMLWGVLNLNKLVSNSLLFNNGFKIPDGCQSWPIIADTNIVCDTLSTICKQHLLRYMNILNTNNL